MFGRGSNGRAYGLLHCALNSIRRGGARGVRPLRPQATRPISCFSWRRLRGVETIGLRVWAGFW